MNKQRLLILIASVIGMISTFLPWYSDYFDSVLGYSVIAGWVSFILFGVCLIATIGGNRGNSLSGIRLWFCVIPGALSLIWSLYFGYNLIEQYKNKVITITDWSTGTVNAQPASISIDYGFYIVILVSFIIAILPFVFKGKMKETTPEVIK